VTPPSARPRGDRRNRQRPRLRSRSMPDHRCTRARPTTIWERRLIRAARRGDAASQARLLSIYEPMVRRIARTLYLPGGDRDDLAQEARVGVIDAARTWDPARGVPFSKLRLAGRHPRSAHGRQRGARPQAPGPQHALLARAQRLKRRRRRRRRPARGMPALGVRRARRPPRRRPRRQDARARGAARASSPAPPRSRRSSAARSASPPATTRTARSPTPCTSASAPSTTRCNAPATSSRSRSPPERTPPRMAAGRRRTFRYLRDEARVLTQVNRRGEAGGTRPSR
jgi:hypothetical protein